MSDSIGDPRQTHPIPLRLRNPYVDKRFGGSLGYRGAGFARARRRVLWLAGYRSWNTGLPQGIEQLEVDHIMPYRIGGLTPHSNEPTNLRVTDFRQNKFSDYAEGFQEKPVVRRMRAF